MDPINNIISAPGPVSLRPAVSSVPVVPQQQAVQSPQAVAEQAAVAASEQQASQVALKLPAQAANDYILGTQQFATFKDATGEYITRYQDMLSGKITYYPQSPQYVKPGGQGVSIEA